MSDEMKLLKALCEALGFLVYVETDYIEVNIEGFSSPGKFRKMKLGPDGRYIRNTDGSYISTLIEPAVTYKLIKKEDIKGELVK